MNKHKIFRGVRNILEGEPDDWLGQESVLKSLGITNIRINLSDHYLLSIPLSIILWNWDAWGRSWPLVFARANRARAFRPIHTRDFSPGACSRGTLREQSSSVCTNDFMGILHPREQNFHPAKCSTIFNRLNIWEQAPGANWANLKTLPRVYWHVQMILEHAPGAKPLVWASQTVTWRIVGPARRWPNYQKRVTRLVGSPV